MKDTEIYFCSIIAAPYVAERRLSKILSNINQHQLDLLKNLRYFRDCDDLPFVDHGRQGFAFD